MKFLENPLEAILNLFGLTMQHKPTLLGMHIHDFTHSSWMEDVRNQNRLHEYSCKH
jgi:hypothetical protein